MASIKINRNNTLDVLRLIAAMFVMLHHSYPLTGNFSPFSTLGDIAVSIFFIISGYVIVQSWYSDPTPLRFFWKRMLRIMPGLVSVVIFSILVIGPINTSLSLQEYFFNINTWMYSEAILIFTQKSLALKTLPGVFMSNTFHEINGSLWTVPLEFRMYIILCIMGVIGMLKDRRVLLSIVMLSCVIYLHNLLSNVWALNICATILGYVGITGYLSPLINYRIPINLSSYNLLFLIGMLFYLYKDQIKFNHWIALGALIGLLVTFVSANSYFLIALLIFLPYLVLYLGQLPIKQLHNIGDRYGDYSYGFYIYAFPVQQTIAHLMPRISPVQMLALSLPATFIIAYFSWWYIEKKALSLKKMDPLKLFLIPSHTFKAMYRKFSKI